VDIGHFRCQKCGKCYHNLITEDRGIIRGLTLLPDEVKLFKKQNIAPAIGQGKNPKDPDFQIISFQLTANDCPQLDRDLCKIYEKRPYSCRQFPFSLEPNIEGGIKLGVDMNCPSARQLVDSFQNFKFIERKYAEKLLQIKLMVSGSTDIHWLYDLKTSKWIKYSQLA
jgi:Fe-S-cluster containining protein